MRANKPRAGENDECLWAQSKLTTAGDTGENAARPEAQSKDKTHENYVRVPQGTTMGTGWPAKFWEIRSAVAQKCVETANPA